MPASHEFSVPEEDSGARLDQFLAGIPGLGLTRSHALRLIKEGWVTVGGWPPDKAGVKLRAGERVAVTIPDAAPSAARPEAIPLEIVYEDGDLVVINKPRGMVVHPAPGHSGGTLVNALLAHCPDLAAGTGSPPDLRSGGVWSDVLRPGIVHRLDKDTSGLLVVAKNAAALQSLSRQLQERTMGREYLALVHGQPPDEGVVEAPIGRHPVERKRMAVLAGGRPAVTRYRVLERFPATGPAVGATAAAVAGRAAGAVARYAVSGAARGGGYALLAVRLETGRTHQIRVHLAHIGHPVAGDPVYGPRRDPLGLAGQALHARRLKLVHPRTGEALEFTAPPPADLDRAIERLRK